MQPVTRKTRQSKSRKSRSSESPNLALHELFILPAGEFAGQHPRHPPAPSPASSRECPSQPLAPRAPVARGRTNHRHHRSRRCTKAQSITKGFSRPVKGVKAVVLWLLSLVSCVLSAGNVVLLLEVLPDLYVISRCTAEVCHGQKRRLSG